MEERMGEGVEGWMRGRPENEKGDFGQGPPGIGARSSSSRVRTAVEGSVESLVGLLTVLLVGLASAAFTPL
jgi:hypothetical protein